MLQDNSGANVQATDVMLQLKAVGVESGRGSQQTAVPEIATLSAAALPAVAPTAIPSNAGRSAKQQGAENEMNSSTQSLVLEAGRYVIKHANSKPRRSRGGGEVEVELDPKMLTPTAPQRLEAAAGHDSESCKDLASTVQVGLTSHLAACLGKSWLAQSDDGTHDLDSIIHPVARRAHTTSGSTQCCQGHRVRCGGVHLLIRAL